MKFLIVCSVTTLFLLSVTYSQDYACEACHDSSCLSNSQCSPTPNCNEYQHIPLARYQIDQLVLAHNDLRNKVATGNQSGQPSASNMYELVWDYQLANIAQCFANKCVFEHMRCELPNGGGGFGQNIYGLFSSNKPDYIDYKNAVQSWFNEVDVFPSYVVDNYQFDGKYGHYSQVVWAETKRLGCGSVLFKEGGWWKNHVYCNYAPSGNWIGSPVYRRGSPATDCSNGRSYNYSGLCANTY